MTKPIPIPQNIRKLTDKEGNALPEIVHLLTNIARALNDLSARVGKLEKP